MTDITSLIVQLDELNKWLVSLEGTEYVDLHTVLDGQEVVQAAREALVAQQAEINRQATAIRLRNGTESFLGVLQDRDDLRRQLRSAEARVQERVATVQAHRACHTAEHDPLHGKIHGYCVVCGIPFPCAYVGDPPARAATDEVLAKLEQEWSDWLRHMLGSPSEMQAKVTRLIDTLKALRTGQGSGSR